MKKYILLILLSNLCIADDDLSRWTGLISPASFLGTITPLVEAAGLNRRDQAGLQNTRLFIKTHLQANGYSVNEERFTTHFRAEDGVNLFAEIPGEGNGTVMVGAHYDSTGPVDLHRPGANDNASGVSGVLLLAQALKEVFRVSGTKPMQTIRFVFFDYEEGFKFKRGSIVHFQRAIDRSQDFRFFVNLDMIGYSPTGRKFLLYDSGKFLEIDKLMSQIRSGFVIEKWGTHRSDQRSGFKYEVPSVSIFESPRALDGSVLPDYPYYHTAEDSVDKINIRYASEMTQFAAELVLRSAQNAHLDLKQDASLRGLLEERGLHSVDILRQIGTDPDRIKFKKK